MGVEPGLNGKAGFEPRLIERPVIFTQGEFKGIVMNILLLVLTGVKCKAIYWGKNFLTK